MRLIIFIFSLAALFVLPNCSAFSDPGPEDVIREDGKVFIVDRTGKRWEVTHAESRYGLEADKFQFGLGPNAILPIANPRFISQGSPAFPGKGETFLVMGTEINGESRAYPIDVMSRHEVAIENFDSTYVTVAY